MTVEVIKTTKEINTPWYRGNGPYFEQNLERQMDAEKHLVDEGKTKWWNRLKTERPSVLANELRDKGKSPKVVSSFLNSLWVTSFVKVVGEKQLVRVVDGYHNEGGSLSPVIVDVHWE